MAKCAAAKALFLGYLGSVAAVAHMAAAPRAFAELKKAMEARLEVIAAPLERLYEEERLGARLGALGEATLGAKVALDDDGLLPMPKRIWGNPPSSTSYEKYLLRLIVMASVALDNLFVRKLRSALEALGDPTKTVVEDREVRIYGGGGALLLRQEPRAHATSWRAPRTTATSRCPGPSTTWTRCAPASSWRTRA